MKQVTVRIPTPLRPYTGGADEVRIGGEDVGGLLQALAERHAGLRERLLDDAGGLRPFVNVFVGSDDIRTLAGMKTVFEEGAVISIVPAVAGGSNR